MTIKNKTLVIEELQDQSNLLFLTLIEYKKQKFLTIIENVIGDEIQAYILDNLSAENINQDWFMHIATKWFYSSSERYPLSFEFTKLGQGEVVKKVLKTFSVNATSRIIGKLFIYPTNTKPKVKRRKVSRVTTTPNIKFKKSIKE